MRNIPSMFMLTFESACLVDLRLGKVHMSAPAAYGVCGTLVVLNSLISKRYRQINLRVLTDIYPTLHDLLEVWQSFVLHI